jgi:hypothetical protein
VKRGPLPPEVEKAARTVSGPAWGNGYYPGEGVMHYGGGPAHARLLRDKAAQWERWAKAARICADYLGDGEFPEPAASSRERPS